MSITIDLPKEIEEELLSEATNLGLPLSDYILQIVYSERPLKKRLKTGAELVAYWQSEGLIGVRSDINDSQEYARKLRENAEKRVRQ